MTATEIRNWRPAANVQDSNLLELQYCQVLMLQEIAAQLAEISEQMSQSTIDRQLADLVRDRVREAIAESTAISTRLWDECHRCGRKMKDATRLDEPCSEHSVKEGIA